MPGGSQKRFNFTKEQKHILRMRYNKKIYPSRKELIEIAAHIGVSERRVQIWYQNHRAAFKRRCEKELQSCNGDSTLNPIQNMNGILQEHNFNFNATVQSGHSTGFNHTIHESHGQNWQQARSNDFQHNQSGLGFPINNFVQDSMPTQNGSNTQSTIPFYSYSFNVDNREVVVNVGGDGQHNTISSHAQNYENIGSCGQQNPPMLESYNQQTLNQNSRKFT